MASETITRNDLTEILNAVLPAVGFTQTDLLRREAITANSTHTLLDDADNYDAYIITMHNASSAGSGQNTIVTKGQLNNNPTTVVATIHFGTQYAIAGITSLSGTTLKIGFLNVSSVSPYMSIVGLKFGVSGSGALSVHTKTYTISASLTANYRGGQNVALDLPTGATITGWYFVSAFNQDWVQTNVRIDSGRLYLYYHNEYSSTLSGNFVIAVTYIM